LDYLDIHLYALQLGPEDQVTKLATLIHKVRTARPALKVTIGETWLYKHGAQEPQGIMNKEAYGRSDFSFWAPLDEQFLRLVLGIAQRENISVVAPYFSQYFFSYYTFGDAESGKLPPWPASVPVSWSKALEAIRGHKLTTTGQAMKTMLEDTRK
jgi:hypothetical protein